MTYRVLIRRNSDGAERLAQPWEFEWDDSANFLWTDGNMGCDCNLHAEFERANGCEPEAEVPCGVDRYEPVHAVLANGQIVEIVAL